MRLTEPARAPPPDVNPGESGVGRGGIPDRKRGNGLQLARSEKESQERTCAILIQFIRYIFFPGLPRLSQRLSAK